MGVGSRGTCPLLRAGAETFATPQTTGFDHVNLGAPTLDFPGCDTTSSSAGSLSGTRWSGFLARHADNTAGCEIRARFP